MKRSFFFHYNKPLSKKAGKPILSIHFGGKCCFVEDLECFVPIRLRVRKTQPHAVMAGKCQEIKIENNKAIIS